MDQHILNLADFDISRERGFLPKRDPDVILPFEFECWERIVRDMPSLLAAGKLRETLDALPVLDTRSLSEWKLERAMLLLSFFGHGYVWENWKRKPENHIPDGVSVPWARVASRLRRPPVLSYASYALHNWRRIDPAKPVELGNIALLVNFLGGMDEEWFILVHVEIEAEAGHAIAAIPELFDATSKRESEKVRRNLLTVAYSIQEMYETLLRMPQHCDPYIYYNRVRPYIHGWKNNPALPDGVVYKGVKRFKDTPQQFRGETGAQSSIIPTLDALLDVSHAQDPLRPYLDEMRAYMPTRHAKFIEEIQRRSRVRKYVQEAADSYPELKYAYNECLEWLSRFRAKHVEYARAYINRQAQKSSANPTAVGTGGTPFVPYLEKHRDETRAHKIL